MINKQIFIAKLKEDGCSESTIRSYCNRLKMFETWLDNNEITTETLNDYKKYLIENRKPQTVCLSIVAINKYLELIGRPERLKTLKLPRSTYRDNIISYDDYKKLLRCCLTNKHFHSGFRYYCIIKVLGTTGIRISELTKITYDDYKRGYADIVSKANHARRVYIPEDTCKAVLQYCDRYNKKQIFHGKTANRGVAEQLKIIAKLAGVNPENVYPHSFRHMFAKMFLKENKDISLLADILGHQSINTTQIYTQKTAKEQEELFKQVVRW